jgi:hypothetical protein
MIRGSRILGLAWAGLLTGACGRMPGQLSPPALRPLAVEVLGRDATRDFSGMYADTTGWRLAVYVPGFTTADSAAVAARVRDTYPRLLDEAAPRELYVRAENWRVGTDTARVDATFGARWQCGGRWNDSFSAYAYRFVLDHGAWRFLDRASVGRSDVAPCLPSNAH